MSDTEKPGPTRVGPDRIRPTAVADMVATRALALDMLVIGMALGARASTVKKQVPPPRMASRTGRSLMNAIVNRDATTGQDIFRHRLGVDIREGEQAYDAVMRTVVERSVMADARAALADLSRSTDPTAAVAGITELLSTLAPHATNP